MNRRFAVLFGFLCLSGVATASEICYVVNRLSAVDQAFLAELAASKIRSTSSTTQKICFNEVDAALVSGLRSKSDATNPQSCLTFEKKPEEASRIEKVLRQRQIAVWSEPSSNGTTLCHLVRDQKKVAQTIKDVLAGTK
jgi:hypothetical protein